MQVIHWLKYWWKPLVLLVLAIILFILAAISAITGNSESLDLLISSVGWWLTFAAILFAGKNALRGLTFQALLKLHEDEGDPKQKAAKKLIGKAKPAKDFSANIYSHVREYVKELSDEDKEKLDDARHRISHFWYRAARLMDLGILDPKEIFESVGPPDILEILEPLEAIRAESDNPEWEPRGWPPMKLLIAWYKQQKRKEKLKQIRPQVPAQPTLYEESRNNLIDDNIASK